MLVGYLNSVFFRFFMSLIPSFIKEKYLVHKCCKYNLNLSCVSLKQHKYVSITPRPQIDHGCSTIPYVSVGPHGSVTMIRSDEHKALSVVTVDKKVYCYSLFTVVGEKREIEYRKCVN